MFAVIASYVAFAAAARITRALSPSSSSEAEAEAGHAWPPVFAQFLFCAAVPAVYHAKNREMAGKVWKASRGRLKRGIAVSCRKA